MVGLSFSGKGSIELNVNFTCKTEISGRVQPIQPPSEPLFYVQLVRYHLKFIFAAILVTKNLGCNQRNEEEQKKTEKGQIVSVSHCSYA